MSAKTQKSSLGHIIIKSRLSNTDSVLVAEGADTVSCGRGRRSSLGHRVVKVEDLWDKDSGLCD